MPHRYQDAGITDAKVLLLMLMDCVIGSGAIRESTYHHASETRLDTCQTHPHNRISAGRLTAAVLSALARKTCFLCVWSNPLA